MNGTKPVQNFIQICPAVFELNHTEKSSHKVISLKLGCKEHITRIIFLNSISKLILVTEECFCFLKRAEFLIIEYVLDEPWLQRVNGSCN